MKTSLATLPRTAEATAQKIATTIIKRVGAFPELNNLKSGTP
jgi:hypothetical protein